ncbi:hypothetical protein HYS47_02510 [Candidatus Woesearchaeota archaeon]|nr:hypothetical protein [Candidatus Woesearchaeota archaeon]
MPSKKKPQESPKHAVQKEERTMAGQQKKDPYQGVLEVLESYDEGCQKPTPFSAVDECCATASHSSHEHNNSKPCCSSKEKAQRKNR